MSADRHTIDHKIVDWSFADKVMALPEFLALIEASRSALSDDEFAQAVVQFEEHYGDDYESGGSFSIVARRAETDAEYAERQEKERRLQERRLAEASSRAAATERQERALLASLLAKYGPPSTHDSTRAPEVQP